MTEFSGFWADGAGGDDGAASLSSPYSDVEFSDTLSKWFTSQQAEGYILPGYSNDLAIEEAAAPAMSVLVLAGAALVRGRFYENDAESTLTIATADGANPRIDRVILRVTFASQTVRLAVITGTPAATPSLPALTQDTTTYEVDIAHVYVQNSVAFINDEDISDKRIFSPNFNGANTLLNSNLIYNSEFVVFSELELADPTTNPPDGWSLNGTPSAITSTTKPAQMSRGVAVQITTDAVSEGIAQTAFVIASTQYVIKSLVNVTSGDVGIIEVTTDSASPGTITREVRRTGGWLEETVYYTTEADATTLTVSLLGLFSGDIIQFGQLLVVRGYIPGDFRENFEYIPARSHFIAHLPSNQVLTSSYAKVDFSTEVRDDRNDYSTSNKRWTPPAGKILIIVHVAFIDVNSVKGVQSVQLLKNGSELRRTDWSPDAHNISPIISYIDDANGTDYYDVKALRPGASLANVNSSTSYFMGITL